jgi:hypothetical protein
LAVRGVVEMTGQTKKKKKRKKKKKEGKSGFEDFTNSPSFLWKIDPE